MDEFSLIDKLRNEFGEPSPGVEVGIGDDAAVVAAGPGLRWAVTTDALVEGVHFDTRYSDARHLGMKALAVNLSDLAAMGAEPRHCLLALTVRDGLGERFFDELIVGIRRVAREHRVSIVGGNLSRAPILSITVTAMGSLPGPSLTRAGGRPGDRLLVTGPLGDAAMGLALLGRGSPLLAEDEQALVERQLAPTPRVAVGQALRAMASAAIDISDGLVQDAGHLARASSCAARIDAGRLPLSPAYRRLSQKEPDPLAAALAGGEDYELLFAVRPELVRTATLTAQGVGSDLHEIGDLAEGAGVVVEEGGRARHTPPGWRHF